MVMGGGNLLELVEARLRRARAGCEARYLARAGRSSRPCTKAGVFGRQAGKPWEEFVYKQTSNKRSHECKYVR